MYRQGTTIARFSKTQALLERGDWRFAFHSKPGYGLRPGRGSGRQPAGRLFIVRLFTARSSHVRSAPSFVASPPCSTVRRKWLPASLRLFRILASFFAGGRCRLDSVGGNFCTCTIFTCPASPRECLPRGDPPRCFESSLPLPPTPTCAFSQSCRRATPPPSRLGGLFFGFGRVSSESVSKSSFGFVSRNSLTGSRCVFPSSSNLIRSIFRIFANRIFI